MSLIIITDYTFTNEYSKDFLNIVEKKSLYLKDKLNAELKKLEKNDLNTLSSANYIEALYNLAEGYEDIIYIPADSPLIDIEETIKLYNQHKENIAYYSYGENYPISAIAEVIRVNAFERLLKLAKEKNIPLERDIIKKLVFVDPNFFEIEIILSKNDMRYYRLDFTANSKRNNILINSLINLKNYEDITEKIIKDKPITQTLPAYVEIEISSIQNSEKINIPVNKNKENKNLTKEKFDGILNKLKLFMDDIHLSIGGHTEPLLNSEVFDILESALKTEKIKVYFETNAILLNEQKSKKLINLQAKYNNLYVLIHLDTVNESVYKKIYKEDHLKTILQNIEYYFLREPKNTYLYIIKQKENFDYLSEYYKYFEKYKVNIIMQKYSVYRNLVKDDRVGNMAPLIKICCWHIQRDLYIDIEGNIPICKYDINKEIIMGNINIETIENIWNKIKEYNKMDNLNNFCANCDDWYLYNF